MCMPLGPRWSSQQGRRPFTTADEIIRWVPLERAMKKYPNNDTALGRIIEFVKCNITHTEKWLINELYDTDESLARIMVEPSNLAIIRKNIKYEKSKTKKAYELVQNKTEIR